MLHPVAEQNPIQLAYSVDADDAFMFEALRAGVQEVDTEGLTFSHRRADTAALNQIALEGGADVVAVSLGAYPAIAKDYLLLPHGASVGRGFGPVVVSPKKLALADLKNKRVGIPGHSTTAWLVLRLIEPSLQPVLVPIAPFSRAFEALDDGTVDVALLIHEGRLLFEQRGLHQVIELGQWWDQQCGLPLPLGVNVVHRRLGDVLGAKVSRVLQRSIDWALENKAKLVSSIAQEDRGDVALQDEAMLDRYLGMYANEDTRQTAGDVRRAIDVLFSRARQAGLLAADVSVQWAP